MAVKEEDITTQTTNGGVGGRMAYDDALERSAEAKEKNPGFFYDPIHLNKIAAVKASLAKRFGIITIYENSRYNRGKSFTALKVSKPHFYRDDRKTRKPEFIKELDSLGGTMKARSTSNGDYIVQIY